MAKAALTLIPPARTPERQRLADAIAERDRRDALVEARRAEIKAIEERRWSIWSRRDELEETVRRLETGHSEAERRDALLRGETLAPDQDIDAVRAQLAAVNDELTGSKKNEAELLNDIQLLNMPRDLARSDVDSAIEAVLLADPVRAALIEELQRLEPRVTRLRQAVGNTFGLWSVVDEYKPGAVLAAPCPWQAVRNRLASDPDARLPMPNDVFAESQTRPAA